MKRFVGFEKGMCIGGWLTNYKRFNVLPENKRLDITIGDMEHFCNYITKKDVAYIASLGMDHIRLGFDQIVIEEAPGIFREEICCIIEKFIDWCEQYKLNIVLNLHKAIGNYCDIKEDIQLLDDKKLINRFINLWVFLESKLSSHANVAFEILNEVRDVDPEKWNILADKTVHALRQINKNRIIILGSTSWNSVNKLKYLKVLDDENIVYTFHTYCVWNYLSTPNDGNRFSLVDDDNRKILSERMAKIIRGDIN